MPTRPILPFARIQKEISAWPEGSFKREYFGMYVDLEESERPNPQTARSFAQEILAITCLKYAKDNSGCTVKDVVDAIGEDIIKVTRVENEISGRKSVTVRAKFKEPTPWTDANGNSMLEASIVSEAVILSMSPGIDRKHAEDLLSYGVRVSVSGSVQYYAKTCRDAEIKLSADYNNFIRHPKGYESYRAPQVLAFKCLDYSLSPLPFSQSSNSRSRESRAAIDQRNQEYFRRGLTLSSRTIPLEAATFSRSQADR